MLVDDHTVVREGVAELIRNQADFEVCGQVGRADEALAVVRRAKPDLVIVDLSLPSGSGLDLIKALKALRPRLRMLVLSMHEEGLYAERALRAGARGYVMKEQPTATLLRAIRTVLKGDLFVSEDLRGQLLARVSHPMSARRSGVAALSDRELEIFERIGAGETTRQIAQRLRVSVSTVETHRGRIKAKLRLRNPAQLARAAVEWSRAR